MAAVIEYPPFSLALVHLLEHFELATLPTDNGDWPAYYSHMPDNEHSPDNIIVCYDTAGVKQNREMKGGKVRQMIGSQVLVRSRDYHDGWLKARNIERKIDGFYRELIKVTAPDEDEWFIIVHSTTRTGPVSPLGSEEKTGRYLFSYNFLSTTEFEYSTKAGDNLHNLVHVSFPDANPA